MGTTSAADPTRVAAVGQAFKQASRIDRARINARAGLVAAIPVAASLAFGTVIGSPTVAVTMGVGAMLSGVAWRSGDGPLTPPIGTMTAAGAGLAIATLAGTLTGRWPWLHLAVLVVFCLVAGSATVLGRRGSVVGTQTVIAFIVFGRFPEGVGDAFAGAALVFAGAMAETLFAFLVAVPLAWRRQRGAVAQAYGELEPLFVATERSSAAAAAALERADASLSVPALFADTERLSLSDLVNEGRRIRLELTVFDGVLRRALAGAGDGDTADRLRTRIGTELGRLREAVALIAAVVGGDADAVSPLSQTAAELSAWDGGGLRAIDERLEERLAALTGQVGAATRLALDVGPAKTAGAAALPALLPGRPTLGSGGSWRRILYDLGRIRESATLQSAAGRHAVRLAVVVAGTELLVQRVALPRGYWAVIAAATVLRPEFAATFTRGAERVLGTLVGVVVATLIAVAIDPNGWGIVVVVAVLAFATYTLFSASFTAGIAGVTGIIVFLLHMIVPDSVQIALDRGLDTLIGGSIGLIAYALWPTWSGTSIGLLMGRLADAQRAYLDAVIDRLIGGLGSDDADLRMQARAARIALTDAESAVGLARSEPRHGNIDPQRSVKTLGALRRVIRAAHGVRVLLFSPAPRHPLPELAPLRDALDEALGLIARSLQEDVPSVREGAASLGEGAASLGKGAASLGKGAASLGEGAASLGEGAASWNEGGVAGQEGAGSIHDHARGRGRLPALRKLYRELDQVADPEVRAVRPALDELIDSINTAAVSIGLEVP